MKTTLLPIVLSLTLLTGCVGNYFTFEQARHVTVGMTEAQVTEVMGRPTTVVSSAGAVRWVYAYGTGLGKGASISFDFRDGKVVEVPEIPDSFK